MLVQQVLILCRKVVTDQDCDRKYSELWNSGFILPAKFLDTVESMCSAFLWSESPPQNQKANVSWKDLCYPKAEGELEVRDFRDTSKVFSLRLI